ncbi:MAG: aldolase/citrate lyase family protein [Alphaproteobacteria bacterium]|nr:aldolase/citrate lyase family protein [Alphaproteobacteria bacterium]
MVSGPLSFGATFRLTLITDDAGLAAEADSAGIDRIGVDLEHLGKAERQAGHDTRLSGHSWDDLRRVGATITRAELFVRLNPVNPASGEEVETALAHGAEVLMLPQFKTPREVATFVGLVRGRAQVMLLMETAAALTRIRHVLAVPGIDEVMFGLNDLRLALGVVNHFEVLASPLIDAVAAEVRRKGLPLGIGGVGRVDDSAMPVPANLVHAQYPRLDATGAWVARSFFNGAPAGFSFGAAIVELRQRLDRWAVASPDELERARTELATCAAEWR